MKTNHILIDYENVQPSVAEVLSPPIFKVWVFIGAQQSKVKVDLLELIQRKGADAQVIRIASTGRNTLDFHLAYYLGKLASEHSEDYFHVVSNDTGLDPLLGHLIEKGLRVSRVSRPEDIPIVKPSGASTDEEKLSKVLAYLVSRGSQRPASWKTLVGSTAALFQPRLDEGEATRLLRLLESNGTFALDGARVHYGLADG